MRTKWTKGEWKASKRTINSGYELKGMLLGDSLFQIEECDGDELVLAIVLTDVPELSGSKGVANANLMAAAPQLCEALELWMDAFNSHLMSSSSKKAQARRAEMWDKANAAMAKARGEQ